MGNRSKTISFLGSTNAYNTIQQENNRLTSLNISGGNPVASNVMKGGGMLSPCPVRHKYWCKENIKIYKKYKFKIKSDTLQGNKNNRTTTRQFIWQLTIYLEKLKQSKADHVIHTYIHMNKDRLCFQFWFWSILIVCNIWYN